MTFSVIWTATAAEEARRLEAAADDPGRIRDAVDRIDYALRRFPADVGEGRVPALRSHLDHRRVWFGDVLAVYYRLDDAALRVDVLAVGPSRRPRDSY